MLTQVGVQVEDEELILPIAGATPKSSLLIRKITGLNPPDFDLFIGEYSSDGGTFQGRRVGERNIVITLDLNPNPALGETVSSLRQKLYKVFNNPQQDADFVVLKFYDDRNVPFGNPPDPRVTQIAAYTEKFDSEPFDLETTIQISMICPDPYIRDIDPTILTNEAGTNTLPFSYMGTADIGFTAQIVFTAPSSALTLVNNALTDNPSNANYWRRRMVIEKDFNIGDRVDICTIRGSRHLWLFLSSDDSITWSLLPYLEPRSTWIELSSDNNVMRVYGETPEELPAYIAELRYVTSYWGL